jgi:anaerobic dimethyl sulfoxide reductase subunit B (iron-sulfur subunit)
METYGWLIDEKRCIECRACESACKQWNKVEIGVGVRRRQVRVYETGAFPMVRQQALTGGCNHCDNAWCMKVCPVKAIWRRAEDGTVQIDQSKCVGCQQCAAFCPYGAPQFNQRTRKMDKCTMCFDRTDAGMEPACATLCPTGALQWGKWSEINQKGSDATDNFANPKQTMPRIRFIRDAYPVAK